MDAAGGELYDLAPAGEGGDRVSDVLDAVLGYAGRGWPVCPWASRDGRKWPLTEHGVNDATADEAQLREWWGRWPDALPGLATGGRSGVIVCDVDVRTDRNGFDDLELLGVAEHPETPTAHSPQGGCHLLFAWPGRFVKTVAGKLGRGLDIRGDGGSAILPPGPGRCWDPHLGLDVPLAPMPEWMVLPEAPSVDNVHDRSRATSPAGELSRYAEAALDGAVAAITGAPAGQQRDTLNREVYGIGGLVAAGIIPAPLALESLSWAAHRISSHDPRRPWRSADLDKMVNAAFCDGLRHPRVAA
jgi:putative DNA primase/helicase